MPELHNENQFKGWCKIIEMIDRDVLIERDFDQDSKQETVRVTAIFNIARVSATMGFDTPQKADDYYAQITQQNITDVFTKIFNHVIAAENEVSEEE